MAKRGVSRSNIVGRCDKCKGLIHNEVRSGKKSYVLLDDKIFHRGCYNAKLKWGSKRKKKWLNES